ncbi:NlpC/P60 family protein [Nonomuraea sp. KC401]|uniref:C40 family peptidase n=1 Tax=unclassified Nonomuraea TaxID=2593643 RepID=UPI0010FE5AF7|nr:MULTISPECIES: C40 family peptidase [unclassified Nonomuraea]NBE96358.1 NlpC/P60 family protein [Nonomuraea sp. K271]TLF47224.1 NlpC/P60 family protein [Nonomuraea sp. KC401]
MRAFQAGLLAVCLLAGTCPPVHAEPAPSSRDVKKARQAVRERSKRLGETSARLATAQSRLGRLAAEVERLVEAYNGELVRLRQAEQADQQARARLAAADAEVELARHDVALLAAETYGGAAMTEPFLGMLMDHGETAGMLHRAGVLEHMSSERAAVLARMRDAQEVAGILRTQAANAYAARRAATERARHAKIAAKEAVARQRRDTKALRAREKHLQHKVDAARTRAQLLARRKAAAASVSGLVSRGSALGDVAANWALTQLGKPYVWAADGPDTYDCSGLTMRAWEKVGVRLDHWTGTQWTSGPHVPLDQLRRGDLVFFGHISDDPGTIHHVGIYVGRGQMVHAPQTGDVVRVASIYRGDLVGATRPR